MSEKSCEQQARDMLERLSFCDEWIDPQKMSAGDVVELANLFSENERLRQLCYASWHLLMGSASIYDAKRDIGPTNWGETRDRLVEKLGEVLGEQSRQATNIPDDAPIEIDAATAEKVRKQMEGKL